VEALYLFHVWNWTADQVAEHFGRSRGSVMGMLDRVQRATDGDGVMPPLTTGEPDLARWRDDLEHQFAQGGAYGRRA
jgi:hypothetical protein